ncbi:MAG: hypothetical protein GXP53_06485 [Deltaproteobacteria bacterium]|nr:hypothetical protein [Deltaproteobacteria bacterium]
MTQKTEKEAVKNQELTMPTPPSLWADNFQLGTREDGICMLRCLAVIPEGLVEQARIMTSRQHLVGLIDVLCSSLDYYPKKKKTKKPLTK